MWREGHEETYSENIQIPEPLCEMQEKELLLSELCMNIVKLANLTESGGFSTGYCTVSEMYCMCIHKKARIPECCIQNKYMFHLSGYLFPNPSGGRRD